MIYVSTACLKHNKISEAIEELTLAGIKNIELSGGTNYYKDLEQDLVKLKDLHGLNYAFHAYFPPPKEPFVVNLASCNDDIYRKSIQHYENCIEMMERIDCRVLSIHAGFLVEVTEKEIGKKIQNKIIYDKEKAYDRFCTAYEKLSSLCKKTGIEFYLENNVLSRENYEEFGQNNYFMMTDYSSIMEMKKRLDFNLLLDLGHLYVSSNTLNLSFVKECEQLAEEVKWYHISDNNGVKDEHKALKRESEIVREYKRICKESICTTIETAADIEAVLESKGIVEGKDKK